MRSPHFVDFISNYGFVCLQETKTNEADYISVAGFDIHLFNRVLEAELKYSLSLDPNFASFLVEGSTWDKKRADNPVRRLTDDGEDVPLANLRTAAQKSNSFRAHAWSDCQRLPSYLS